MLKPVHKASGANGKVMKGMKEYGKERMGLFLLLISKAVPELVVNLKSYRNRKIT